MMKKLNLMENCLRSFEDLRRQINTGIGCWWRDPEDYSPCSQLELFHLRDAACKTAVKDGFQIVDKVIPLSIKERPLDLVTVSQAARNAHCTRQTIYDALKNGRLTRFKAEDSYSSVISMKEIIVWAKYRNHSQFTQGLKNEVSNVVPILNYSKS